MYKKIKDPISNNFVNIDDKLGMNIIKKYLNFIRGGSSSNPSVIIKENDSVQIINGLNKDKEGIVMKIIPANDKKPKRVVIKINEEELRDPIPISYVKPKMNYPISSSNESVTETNPELSTEILTDADRVSCEDILKKILDLSNKLKSIETNDDNCDKITKFNDDLEKSKTNLRNFLKECKKSRIKDEAKTRLKLIKLLEIIKDWNISEVSIFLDKFPHTGSINNDSHVFEALWKLVFLFNYDDLKNDNEKRLFYKKLETNEEDTRSIIDVLQKTNVNESNKSGIADLYFKHISDSVTDSRQNITSCNINDEVIDVNYPSCVDNFDINDISLKKKKNYLFSSKYFNTEKGISEYDISEIFIEALPRLDTFNIILLVKNKIDLEKKISKTHKNIATKFHKILDLDDLNFYYKKILFDLKDISVDDYILRYKDRKDQPSLSPRFHQQYFINYTSSEIIDKSNTKFIWGAVPRSGKSYMIAGLIAKIKPRQVVIFLGAISETIDQFYKMFVKYNEFKDYNKVNILTDGFEKIDPDEPNIVLISQENARQKKIRDELLKILYEDNKLIFFDEIHKGSGGGTEDSQQYLLNNYVFFGENEKKLRSPFIMVTATFAKPLIKYTNKGGKETKLLQWRYEDIQNMKEINNIHRKNDIIKNIQREDDGICKADLFDDLLSEYIEKGISLDLLAEEYKKYPELILMCPTLENISEKDKLEKYSNLFSEKYLLNEDTICNTVFKCTNTKWSKEQSVNEFIHYIMENVYNNLLKKRFKYDVFNQIHTELWFLPTICHNKKKTTPTDTEVESTRIEPITRLLAKTLMNNPYFRRHYCILVINSQKLPNNEMDTEPYLSDRKSGYIYRYPRLTVTSYERNGPCISTKCVGNTQTIGECIMKEEACAKAQNKSLIILTGQRLRLGISLPCVDIVLHMDPIKSVDVMYQSMFRVLTERENKQQAFFIDLLSERFIDFIYKYDDYTNKSSNNIDIKSRRKNIIDKLISFNINGINTNMFEDHRYVKMYDNIFNQFEIKNDEQFMNKYESIKKDGLEKLFKEDINIELINKLFRDIQYEKSRNDVMMNPKIKKEILKRQQEVTDIEQLDDDDYSTSQSIDSDTEEDDSKELTEKERQSRIKSIIQYITDIFSLYVLFENYIESDINYDCGIQNIERFKYNINYDLEPEHIASICSSQNIQILELS